jgi:hypothetical protein
MNLKATKMSELNLEQYIKSESVKHSDVSYWGSNEEVQNANEIYDLVLSKGIVDQEWFDERLKCTSPELLSELLKELR